MPNKFFKSRLNRAILIFATLAFTLSGCASTSTQNTRFYTLENTISSPPVHTTKQAVYIDLLPIKMPEYLKRPQIVTHSRETAQVNILEQSRWASPFDRELQDALSAGIAQQTNAVMTLRSNRETGAQAYRLAVNLLQLNAYPNDRIIASFNWSLTGIGQNPSANNTISCRFNADETISDGTEGVVKGTQMIVQKLVAQISTAVEDFGNQQQVMGCPVSR